MKRVQVEPHLSVTGACSAEWVPIKPKTDAAFLFALIHVHAARGAARALDLEFLTSRTGSPYLVGPNGYFLRDRATRKPLVWDGAADAPCVRRPASPRRWRAASRSTRRDRPRRRGARRRRCCEGETAFTKLVEHMRRYTPEWAQPICDVPAATIRRIADEYLDHARVGETIEIDGKRLPYRPVAVSLGKTVNNGWGGYECCWARTLLATLVGALEVPGGTSARRCA